MLSTGTRLLSVLVFALFLAACESSEERAEQHYQSGLALLEEGDVDRALVELRNVFNLNGSHREARRLYAGLVRERGQTTEAYGQYLRLVEQFPDDLEGRRALAEMAVVNGDWQEAERHLTAAKELAPEDPAVQSVDAIMQYRQAVLDEDVEARRAATDVVRALVQDQPDNFSLQRILIDSALQDQNYVQTLQELDRALVLQPDDPAIYAMRLSVLNQLGDFTAMEAQMRDMVVRFPEDDNIKATLLRFYVARREVGKAEAFLREISDPASEETGNYVSLIRFLAQVQGTEAALAELDEGIAVSPNPQLLRSIRAGLRFQEGAQESAIAEMQEIIAGAEDNAQTHQIKVMLARMLMGTGNEVGARRLVEEVLTTDASQVEALQMRAAWLIEGDQADAAIAALRTALDQAPDNSDVMTLMAQAHSRNGNHELARDMLSLAVEASNSAPAESVRYAEVLFETEAYGTAEDTLLAALRIAPGNVQVLGTLGRLYILMEDASRARQVENTLRRIGSPVALQSANSLQLAIVQLIDGDASAVQFLEDLAASGGDNAFQARVTVLRARLAQGETEEALQMAQEMLAEDPQNPTRQYVLGATQAYLGAFEAAEAIYRELLPARETSGRLWLELARVVAADGRADEAAQVIRDGIEATSGDLNLMWALASFQERAGEIDAAITTYEEMYARDSNSPVIANNLASLLSTWRQDDESVERAFTIARRLRGTDVPAFQDTYGWLQYKRGNYEDALEYLQPAAEALSEDPVVQMHLGLTLSALERNEEALAQLQAAVELAGPADTRPSIERGRAEIQRLLTAPDSQ